MRNKLPDLVVSAADYLYFVDRAVRGMGQIVTELGDGQSCVRPDMPGANTPYGLLSHCLGVIAYWGGHVVAGREVVRDRPGEFEATGSTAELPVRVDASLAQLRADLSTSAAQAPLRYAPDSWALGPDRPMTQATALFHLYEEVAQHHGQMQILRDALRSAEPGGPAPSAAEVGFNDVSINWLRHKSGVKWHRPGDEVIPAWVADMDYPIAPVIRAALEACMDRGDLGYPDWPTHPLAEPFGHRMQSRYDWSPDPDYVRGLTDVIQALQIVISLATQPGDAIVAHTPNYSPFLATIASMGRTLVPAPLQPEGSAGWTWDHEQLDAQVSRARAKVLLLVNPHNPTGRVFTVAELQRIAELADRHDLIVISDEIHAELAHHPNRHVPFASLSAQTASRTVTVTSATKAFNIAGLRTAVAHVGPAHLRRAWDAQPPDLFGATNVLGVEATLAAWSDGDDWLAGLNAHLLLQREHLVGRLAETSGVTMRRPEASYLAWLDCRGADLGEDPATWLRRRAGVELSPGPDFGPDNDGYARLNFATTTALLDELVDRLSNALQVRA
ncbi:MAG: aminotransferase class I/II-fold pyridoxal phosphate-dependent enzyme [Jatrophihabitantaceae bacterium]